MLDVLDLLAPTNICSSRAIDALNTPVERIVCVAVDGELVVGVGTLIVENKVIHGASIAGRIEDVAVDADYQGEGVGRQLLEGILQLASDLDCYKVTLSCNEENVGFYEKCGFRRHDIGMRIDL